MGLITPAILTAARVRVITVFNDALKSKESVAYKIGLCRDVPSDIKNLYAWMAQTNTRMREWPEGTARELSSMKERVFASTARKFEKTIEHTRDQIDRNRNEATVLSQLTEGAKQLGIALAKLPDDLTLELLKDGQNIPCADGQSLFDVDHPVSHDATGAQSNYSASGMPLNPANYMTVRATQMAYQDEDGRVVDVLPGTLLVPTTLEKSGEEAVLAEFGANGATNVANKKANVVVWGELNKLSTTGWFSFDGRDVGAPPIIMQKPEDLEDEIQELTDLDGYFAFMHDKFLQGARAWRAAVPGEWKKIYKAAA